MTAKKWKENLVRGVKKFKAMQFFFVPKTSPLYTYATARVSRLDFGERSSDDKVGTESF